MYKSVLVAFLTIFIGGTFYGQSLSDKEKQDGAINPSIIDLLADLSPYIQQTQDRTFTSEVLDFTTVDIRLSNFRGIEITARDESGAPTFIRGKIAELPLNINDENGGESLLQYLRKLNKDGDIDLDYYGFNLESLKYIETNTGKAGDAHLTYQQLIGGVPVYGAGVKVHVKDNQVYAINGIVYELVDPVEALIDATEALTIGYESIERVKGQVDPQYVLEDKVELVYYSVDREEDLRLAYFMKVYPQFNEAWSLFIDAQSGELLDKYSTLCNLTLADGPATATATDLNGKSRKIHTYQVSNNYFLIDASRPMYRQSPDILNDPIGAIWTLDGQNTFPANSDFSVAQLTSPTNNWSNAAAVSAHYNAAMSYEYFKNTFNRNSIDGNGGTIISVINVSDEGGQSMENAFWNGRIMWYGNGGTYFKPLAGGLDVGGHEMTHGVIEATANLEYRNESGALNESFADIFGVMIDRDNWQIGEDVVKPSFGAPALRDMANPHNGGHSINDRGYQPAHYSERYQGTQDNGGVHINSGIPNHAYFLFAEAIGKDKAEQVFYHALINYLNVRSSFIDLRASVEQACLDLYGNVEKEAASSAFANVGIGKGGNSGGNGGNGNTYEVNPGKDWAYVINRSAQLGLHEGNGNHLGMLNQNIRAVTKPSVTDDGSIVVYVTDRGEIYYHVLEFGAQVNVLDEGVLINNNNGEWGNVTISDDGRHIAFVSNYADKMLFVGNLETGEVRGFELYNPTKTEGVVTGNVRYADALEFNHDGEHVFYDAYNELKKTNGASISYWNVGVINVVNKNNWGTGNISLLLGSLPEGVSIGNPSIAKNSDAYLAIDIIEEGIFEDNYSVGMLHVYENEGYVFADNSRLSYPDFTRKDDQLLLTTTDNTQQPVLALVDLRPDFKGFSDNPMYFSDGQIGTWFGDGFRVISDNEPVIDDKFKIYPNPLKEICHIEFDKSYDSQSKLSLYEQEGGLLSEYKMPAGQLQFDIPMDLYPAGTYYLHISTSDGLSTHKLIKH